MSVNHEPQKKKTEEFIVKLPTANISLLESDALTIPKPEIATEKKEVTSFHRHVYDNFTTWTNGSVSQASAEVQAYLKPITDVVNRFIKTVDINKIDRDLTEYAESSLKSVQEISYKLKKNVDDFVREQLNAIEKQPQDGSFLGTAKQVLSSSFEYVKHGVMIVMPYVDSLGTKVLGEMNYSALTEVIGRAYVRAMQLLKNFFEALNFRAEEQKSIFEFKIAKNNSAVEIDLSTQDAKDSSRCLEEIGSFSKGYFNEKNEDFLARRITDVEEDGIRQEQPDVIRKELLGDISRNVIDPFPTYENREKDREEVRDKNKLESIGRFVRVGVDGELAAIDKLELLTKIKSV